MKFELFRNSISVMYKRKILFVCRIKLKQLFSSNKYAAIAILNIYTFEAAWKNNILANTFIPNCCYFRSILLHVIHNRINNRNMIRSINTSRHIA